MEQPDLGHHDSCHCSSVSLAPSSASTRVGTCITLLSWGSAGSNCHFLTLRKSWTQDLVLAAAAGRGPVAQLSIWELRSMGHSTSMRQERGSALHTSSPLLAPGNCPEAPALSLCVAKCSEVLFFVKQWQHSPAPCWTGFPSLPASPPFSSFSPPWNHSFSDPIALWFDLRFCFLGNLA